MFYALNAALIVSSFVFSWWMFRSNIFSFTLALCMAFGTQFHWIYNCSPIVSLYLFVIYVEANLLCLLKVVQSGTRAWKAAFLVSLIVVALCHEQWLDYFGFLFLGGIFLWLGAWHWQAAELKRRVAFALLAACAVAVVYLSIQIGRAHV